MDYAKIYKHFIESRRNRPALEGYTETHHILPRSLGGGDDAENLITLTAREHFISHLLLARIHGGSQWAAVWFMCHKNCNSGKNTRVTSHTYNSVKVAFSHMQKTRKRVGRSGKDHPLYGKKHSQASREKMSAAQRGEKNHCFGKNHTPEHCRKISAALKGKYTGELNSQYGKKASLETRQLLSSLRQGDKHPCYIKQKYVFSHEEFGEVISTPYELRMQYNLLAGDLSLVVSNKRKSTRGWKCLGEYLETAIAVGE